MLMPDDNAPAQTRDPAATDITSDHARAGAKKRRDPNEPAAVVGLGASAGGIAPLQQFFADMDPASGLAFVVVMHLSPEHESQLASVIQQKTRMPVTQVTASTTVRPNHVYVIPPNHQLTFNDSMLELIEPQQPTGRRVTIDLFFRTLAQAYGQRAVCIILSGTDSDGVIGIKHIRAQGGVTIAQDPGEAEHDSMPQSAIGTGMVDWVLPVAQMPARLLDFVRNEHAMQLPPEIDGAEEPDAKVTDAPGGETVSDETGSARDEEALAEVLRHLRAQTGHDFSHYKRATVLRRIARRLQVNSLESIPNYLDFLRKHPAENHALLADLLIGVTHFFRDHDAFAVLEANIPQLFTGKHAEDELRVWVPGCATGEEAYSIAMLLVEHCERLDNPPSVHVFATDLDDAAVSEARSGGYPRTIEADVSLERLRRFFVRDHGRYRVRKELRERLLFSVHNLLADPPFSRCDLISCRNLLIYLNQNAQVRAFDIFHFALRPGGLLFIGGSETAGNVQGLFSPVESKERLYVRRSVPRPGWKMPVLPRRETSAERTAVPITTGRRLLPALTSNIAAAVGEESPHSLSAGAARRDALFAGLHLRLLEEYGPPSVLVNDTHDIVHLSPQAGRYLQFVAGEPTANVVSVVCPELRVELRTLLFKAAQTKKRVSGPPQQVEIGGETEAISLEVRPIEAGDSAQGFYLVLFNKEAAVADKAPDRHETTARGLDEEIQWLKCQLSDVTEQYEATTEELKASNEELQATNEEMRSTTEELETSREELQSTNEELLTVNAELKANVEELSHTNADLTNLMASTDIATVFLNRELRIQRFTPNAQKIFNLIPADVGRAISDITHRLHYDGLIDDAQRSIDDLATIEREVRVGEDHWHLARLAPYRTSEDRIAGVVATFIDITRRKRAEDALRESEQFVRSTLDSFTSMIAILDADGAILDVNEAWKQFARQNGYAKPNYGVGENYLEVTHRAADAGALDARQVGEGIKSVLNKASLFFEFEYPCHSPEGFRWFMVNVSPLATARAGAVVWHTDITARKQAEEALRATNEQFRVLADSVPQIIWTNTADGSANYFNKRWFDYSGLSYEESLRPGQTIVHPDDAPASKEKWQQALANGEVFDCEYRLRRADGEYRWFIGRNVPLKDAEGRVTSWFGSATDIQDLKEAEAALRESEERYRLLVDGARDYAIFLLNPSNEIVYWSAGAERVFGWTAEEAIGQSGELVFTPEDREREQEETEIEIALKDGNANDRRWHIRKDGTRIWVDGVMHRLEDEKTGALRGFAKVARDRTEARMAEEELQRAHEELEQRVRERTAELRQKNRQLQREVERREMLEREILRITERERARISQDLHDSLCQELTATAFLLKSRAKAIAPQSKVAADSLTEAAETVNANAGLARDLARGLHPMELGASGLPSALRELCSRTNESVSCRCDCPRSLRLDENVAVNLYRIAQEAVLNSTKHANANQIVICLERTNGEIILTVSDDGEGKRRRGRGLGTHIMQYRARAAGGTLRVESVQGRGTTVTCRLPLKAVKR